jgi:phosphoribosylanthranilate isomerase
MPRVKICGNTDAAQIRMGADAGADCLGFVVEYPTPVPWNLNREDALKILAQVPPFVSRAVVTGGSATTVLELARFLKPHFVQLHTDNPPEEIRWLAAELSKWGIGLVCALRINVDDGTASGATGNPVKASLVLEQTGICALLVDARTESMPAGTGRSVSLTLARSIRQSLSIPLILAGGLTPLNVQEAIRTVEPYGVDVISGVESSRGVKDPALVREFVRRAKL